MNDNTESTSPLNEPLEDHDYSGDPVAHAARILVDAGVDIYDPTPNPELERHLRTPSTSPRLRMTEADIEALVNEEDFDDFDSDNEVDIEDNVAQAARLLKDVGIDLYALIPDLDYLVYVASMPPEPEAFEGYEDLDEEDLEDIREMAMMKWFDLACGSGPCEHPEHND